MRKIIVLLIAFSFTIILASCGQNNTNAKIQKETEQEIKREILTGIIPAPLNNDGNIEINEESITENAAFLSYDADGTIIGLVAVRGTDNEVRVTLGTCQACSPHPKAYFVQNDEMFQCQKCGNEFHVDTIGIAKEGCNPIVIEQTRANDVIIISTECLETFKELFLDWDGPKT